MLTVLFICTGAHAQLHFENYRGYFLVGKFGEVCTTCEATVLCTPAGKSSVEHRSVPSAGEFVVLHLQARGFWSQMSTIWELVEAAVDERKLAARGHTRPAHIYRVEDGRWSVPDIVQARLQLEPGRLDFGRFHIDRISREWRHTGENTVLGSCERLPLWDTLETIAAKAPAHGRRE